MQEKQTSRYKLLKRTGVRETSVIGNSRRAIVANNSPVAPKKVRQTRRGCSGCSRNQRKK